MKINLFTIVFTLCYTIGMAQKQTKNPVLAGNWYKTDGSKEWVLGLYDSIAIYQSQAWKCTFSASKKRVQLNLQANGIMKTLYAKKAKNETFNLYEDKSRKLLLSRDNHTPLSAQFDTEFGTVLKSDSAVYKGYIKGYSPKLGFKTGHVAVDNNVTGRQESYLITIAPDGSYSAKFPMLHPAIVFVRFPKKSFNLYCEPGKETFHFIDLGQRRQEQQFMGECELINQELLTTKNITDYDYDKFMSDINGFSSAQFKAYILDRGKQQLNALEAYDQEHHLSKKTKAYLQMDITYGTASKLFEYNWNIEAAYRKANKIPSGKKGYMVKPMVLDSAHFDYVRQLPLNKEMAIITQGYNILINRLKFSDPVNVKFDGFTLPQLAEQLRKQGTVFSPEDEEIIKAVIESEKVPSKDSVAAKKQNEELSKKTAPFYTKYKEEINPIVINAYDEKRYDKIRSVFQLEEGLMLDLIYAQNRALWLQRTFKPLSDKDIEMLKDKISIPFVTSAFEQVNNTVKLKLEKNKKSAIVANEVPKTTADSLFDAIMDKYKGNVVYVDFWATWCAPCMGGIERIASLKEEMKNENVVFVYITNPTSPIQTYNNVIPDIKGEHYRVSQDEWNYLKSKFKISGIPHYVLVNKKGEVVNPDLGHLGNSEIKEKIMSLNK